jgi:L-asparaginase II
VSDGGLRRRGPIRVEVWRGEAVESLHTVVAAVVDRDGREVERYGDPDFVTFWRSSAKPLQERPWIEDGTVDHWGWGSREIAVIAASHTGTDEHVALVRRMLADVGLSEDDLRCDRELKARHNCSGNHIGMLAGCRYHGWDVSSYQRRDHPAQQAMLACFADAVAMPVADIRLGVDGCGIVVYATPVTVAARAYARLPVVVPRVAAAMREHPVLVEGEGELDTVVMQGFPGTVSKAGAEGLGCVSLPDGRGLAVKVIDGGDRAVEPAQVHLLARLLGVEIPDVCARRARPPVVNDVGDVVGELVACLP